MGLMSLRNLLVCLVTLLTYTTTASAQAPALPSDLKIVPPTADVPKHAAAFSGTWSGIWGGHLDHILVVEKIEGTTVQIVYSWGVAPAWNIRQPGYSRVTATIGPDGVLQATLRNGAEVTYKLSSDQKSLSGEYTLRGNTTYGVFKRQP